MRSSAAARLLLFRFRIPPGARKFLFCELCMLSGRGLCDGHIPYPGETYVRPTEYDQVQHNTVHLQ